MAVQRLAMAVLLIFAASCMLYLYLALPSYTTAPDRAVQETVLNALSEKIPTSEFSFYSHPTNCRGLGRDLLTGIDHGVYDDFLVKNSYFQAEPGPFDALATKYYLVSRADSLRLYAGDTPELKQIPKQLINLSRVGFNSARTEALLCIESEESGDLVYLHKSAQDWRVQKWLYLW